MQTYSVAYYRTSAIIEILVFIPLLLAGIFVSIILTTGNMPEWMLITASCLLVILSITCTLIIYKRYGALPCEVQMSESGLDVKLLRHSFLYSISHYSSNWGNIENVSTNYDPNHNRRFYQVTFKKPKKTINLIPAEKVTHSGHETDFGNVLMNYVQNYNKQHQQEPTMQIHSRGFYDTVLAKVLTFLAWAMIAVIIIVKIISPGKISIWRSFAALAYSGMWLTAYYISKRKR